MAVQSMMEGEAELLERLRSKRSLPVATERRRIREASSAADHHAGDCETCLPAAQGETTLVAREPCAVTLRGSRRFLGLNLSLSAENQA
jgi:hypothetical protein